MNKGTAIVGFLLCFIAGMGLMWGVDRNGSAHQGGEEITAAAEGGTVARILPSVSSKDPVWGNRNAPVTLVLFSDFQCPFCSKVETTISQLKEKYGPEKLRVVWKSNPLPFHPNARPASLAAETVFRQGGSKAFWKFHDWIYENQEAITVETLNSKVMAWAPTGGVDAIQLGRCVEHGGCAQHLAPVHDERGRTHEEEPPEEDREHQPGDRPR